MRIDLPVHCIEACFEKKMLLLLELHLDAQGIPHLQRNAHHDRSAETNKNLHPWLLRNEREEFVREPGMDPASTCLGRHDQEQHQELAVDAWAQQNPPDPTVKA